MTLSANFQDIFAKACQGSEADLRRLIDEYGPHLQRVVRHRLDERMRAKFDSLDFVQMVWMSFFADPHAVERFDTPERLIGYLAAMARNKVTDEERRRVRKRNGTSLERPIDEQTDAVPQANATTPSQFAMVREAYQIFEANESERDRAIVQLRMQGCTFREIAERMELHERTVRKIVERLVNTHS